MIKINVAEIKKRLVGSESFQYDLAPAQLNLSPEDADLEGHILVEGELSNGGDVILLTATEQFVCHGTCARCRKAQKDWKRMPLPISSTWLMLRML